MQTPVRAWPSITPVYDLPVCGITLLAAWGRLRDQVGVSEFYVSGAKGNGAKIPQPSRGACQEVTHTEAGDAEGLAVENFLFSLWSLLVSGVG